MKRMSIDSNSNKNNEMKSRLQEFSNITKKSLFKQRNEGNLSEDNSKCSKKKKKLLKILNNFSKNTQDNQDFNLFGNSKKQRSLSFSHKKKFKKLGKYPIFDFMDKVKTYDIKDFNQCLNEIQCDLENYFVKHPSNNSVEFLSKNTNMKPFLKKIDRQVKLKLPKNIENIDKNTGILKNNFNNFNIKKPTNLNNVKLEPIKIFENPRNNVFKSKNTKIRTFSDKKKSSRVSQQLKNFPKEKVKLPFEYDNDNSLLSFTEFKLDCLYRESKSLNKDLVIVENSINMGNLDLVDKRKKKIKKIDKNIR